MRKEKIFLFLVGLLIFVCGVIYSIYLGDKIRYEDEREYISIAKNLVSRGLFSINGVKPTAYRPPGYPFVLASLLFLSNSLILARILNFLALMLCIFLIYKILNDILSPFAGLIGALFFLVYPVLFYTAGTFYPQTTASLIFLFILRFFTRPEKLNGVKSALLGIAYGFLILVVPSFVFSLFVIIIWFLFLQRGKIKKSFLFLFFACSMVLPFAWTIRNYLVFKAIFFVSTNSGLNLLLGNSENASPNAGLNVDISHYVDCADTMNEVERDKFYKRKSLEWIFSNKARAFKLYILKWLNHFNYTNRLATKSEEGRIKDIIMFLSYYFLLTLVGIRVALIKRLHMHMFEKLALFLYFSFPFYQAIFFTRIRYRLPYDILLFISGAVLLENRLKNFKILLR